MATQASKSDLHKAMAGTETTDHWDVLVSYSEDHLNDYLKTRWNDTPSVCEVNLKVSQPHGKRTFVDIYDLKLRSPSLRFVHDDQGAWAELTLPVSGTYRAEEDGPEDAIFIEPGKFHFTVQVQISAVCGVSSDHTGSDSIIHFGDDAKGKYYITFRFDNRQSVWHTHFTDNGHRTEDDANHIEALNNSLDAVRKKFQDLEAVQHIDFSLAEITNEKHKDSLGLLTPTAFALSSQAGVLNVFIATKGGGRGKGSAVKEFQLKTGFHYTPVPEGYGASIIISRYLLVEKFLIPQIAKNAESQDVKFAKEHPITYRKATEDEGGIKIELRYDQPAVILGGKRSTSNYMVGGGSTGSRTVFYPTSVDFKTHPLTLRIYDEDSNPVFRWVWKYAGSIAYCFNKYYTVFKFSSSDEEGRTSFSGEVIARSKRAITMEDDKISLALDFTSGHQPKLDCARGSEHWADLSLELPEFKIRTSELDFFRTTNIFAPGRKMIDVKDVMIPCDLVILGNITR